MSTLLPPPNIITTSIAAPNHLFAAVDIGTNSVKLTLVRIDPNSGVFTTLNRITEPVLLGLDANSSSVATISGESIDRAISALTKFQHFIAPYSLPPSHLRLVATSAVREASNQSQFILSIHETLNLNVEILTGDEEARIIYLGVLQFFPVYTSTVLAVDIGGGSTEFTVGFEGNVLFSKSLKLGHVTLTTNFVDTVEMRDHIRSELRNSGLIEKIKEHKIDIVIGSSGTIKAIEKGVYKGYARKREENVSMFEEFVEREWKFNRKELMCLLERLCEEEREIEGKLRRDNFFKRRSGFILAGTVLLDEIFDSLGIDEMEVSGYALGEGVIAEMIGEVFKGFDLNANARWRSIFRLASRFNNKKRMAAAAKCAGLAREVFECLRKSKEVSDEISMFLDDKDLEYLEAASLLHNIGLSSGKKGYHKQSYRIIMNGDHLHGYSEEEVKLIALLARHHRKKFPKNDTLKGSTKEVKQKFRILSAIMRISAAVQKSLSGNFQIMEFVHSPEGFKLVIGESEALNLGPSAAQPLPGNMNASMEKELEYFKTIFKKNLSIVVTSGIS